MKQKDIVLVIVVAFVAGVLSLVVSRFLFASPQSRQQTAEVVDVITPSFPTPPPKYFNGSSVNPSQPISIGTGNNSQ